MRFVITGYPRSGHAWLANYLYKGESIVSHEGALSFLHSGRTARQAHIEVMRSLDGDCSSSWLLYPDLLRVVPRVVVIERPLPDVVQSFRRVAGRAQADERRIFQALEEGFHEALKQGYLVLPYEPKYSMQTIERICGYIGEPFDLVRYALLRNTRVTQATSDALAAAQAASSTT